jgi:hypothetical protein
MAALATSKAVRCQSLSVRILGHTSVTGGAALAAQFPMVSVCPGRMSLQDSDCIDEEREEVRQGASYATDAATRSTSGCVTFSAEEWSRVVASAMVASTVITAAEPSGLWGLLQEGMAGGWALRKVGAQI